MTAVPLPEVPEDRVSGFATHDVLNQPGALENYDAYCGDRPLVNAVRVFAADWAAETLTHTGTLVGSEKGCWGEAGQPIARRTHVSEKSRGA